MGRRPRFKVHFAMADDLRTACQETLNDVARSTRKVQETTCARCLAHDLVKLAAR